MTTHYSITPEKEARLSQYFYRQLLGKTPALTRRDVALEGKTAIITGSNTGLGLEVARQLLDLGLSKLILAVRNLSKGDAARQQLAEGRAPGSCEIDVCALNLSSYDSIVEFAERAKALEHLEIAVLNAGVFKADEGFDPSTGFEDSIQINYLSNALLMTLLLPALKGDTVAPPGRLVILSSDTAGWVSFHEKTQRPILAAFTQKAAKWDMQERYGTSKLLGQFFLAELARRVPASVVTIDAVNPGFCYGTELQRDGKGTLLGFLLKMITRVIGKSSQMGALSIVHAAVNFGQDVHGQYVEDGEIRPMAPIVYTPEGEEIARQLWEETMKELSFAHVQESIQQLEAGSA